VGLTPTPSSHPLWAAARRLTACRSSQNQIYRRALKIAVGWCAIRKLRRFRRYVHTDARTLSGVTRRGAVRAGGKCQSPGHFG
jgi:hypothetical protein